VDDWIRASAVLLHLNYGSELVAFLEERGEHRRLRPWFEAVRALHLGDRRLLKDLAAEIRPTAEWFFDAIEKRLAALPAATRRRPVPATKPNRRKSGPRSS
jgi:hypothetical protein